MGSRARVICYRAYRIGWTYLVCLIFYEICVLFCKILKKMVENVENMLYNKDKLFGKLQIIDCIEYTKMI